MDSELPLPWLNSAMQQFCICKVRKVSPSHCCDAKCDPHNVFSLAAAEAQWRSAVGGGGGWSLHGSSAFHHP